MEHSAVGKYCVMCNITNYGQWACRLHQYNEKGYCLLTEIRVIFGTECIINLRIHCISTVSAVNVQQHLLATFCNSVYRFCSFLIEIGENFI